MVAATQARDRILVVEDDAPAREAMVMLLQFEGYEVRSASGGTDALTIAIDWSPDLVLSDVRMPHGDGFTLVSALRNVEGCKDVPILLVSAHDEMDRRISGLELGADDFISKPVQPEELLARIRAHLRSSHRRKELQKSCTIDSSTQLLNRRGIDGVLAIELDRARRGASLSVLVVDLDDFKSINDTHGHRVGDQVLQATAERMERTRRSIDQVGRLGGDEFIIILASCDAKATPAAIQRFRQAIEGSLETNEGVTVPIRCSIGAASYTRNDSAEELLSAADKAMYKDKKQRRLNL